MAYCHAYFMRILTFEPRNMQNVVQRLSRFPARVFLVGHVRGYGTRLESKPWKQRPNRRAKLALILTEDVPKLGSSGHVVGVEHGYGRNWLLPQGKAVYATPDNMRLYNAKEQEDGSDSDVDIGAFIRSVFTKHEICISRGEQEEWAIYEHHIAKELRRFRLHIPLDCIQLDSPLTSFGEHPVIIRVNESTDVPFTVKVVPNSSTTTDESLEYHIHVPYL